MASPVVRWPPQDALERRRREPLPAPARRRFALPAALLVGATALARFPEVARAAEGAPCQPGARLTGDRALVAPIGRALRARGVTASDRPGACPHVAVEVTAAPSGFHLVIFDQEGRESRRQLPSAESAALVIESWSRGDLATPLPAESIAVAMPVASPASFTEADLGAPDARAAATEAATPAAPAPVASAPGADLHARAARVEPTREAVTAGSLLSLAVAGESAFALDRSSWWGASAGICVRTGRLCTGLLGRYGRAISSMTDLGAPVAHQELDLSLATQWPIVFGAFRIVPNVGAGVGRGQASFASAPLEIDASEPGRTSSRGDGGRRGSNRRGPHNPTRRDTARIFTNNAEPGTTIETEDRVVGHAGLTLSLPIVGPLALDVGFSLGMVLYRQEETRMPRERLRAGVGLRYGGW